MQSGILSPGAFLHIMQAVWDHIYSSRSWRRMQEEVVQHCCNKDPSHFDSLNTSLAALFNLWNNINITDIPSQCAANVTCVKNVNVILIL